MAGADVGGPEKQDTGKKGLRRPKRRLGIRIDMTPMVDIAFLLLIFYMVTTVFAMPQAMEVNLPPASDEDIEVAESKLLTLRVDDESRFYWNMGKDLPIPMRVDSLRTLLIGKNKEIPKLNTLIIIHKDAKYKTMVDILDEIDLIERSFNAATAKEMDVTLKEFNDPKHDRYEEFQKRKFSYRYAMKPWEDSDSRRIEKVLSQMGGE